MATIAAVAIHRSAAIWSYPELQGGNPNAGVNNLQRVGFHGIPTQFKPPQVLSEGDRDRMRVALAIKWFSVQHSGNSEDFFVVPLCCTAYR